MERGANYERLGKSTVCRFAVSLVMRLWICTFYRNSVARSIVISCAFYRNVA